MFACPSCGALVEKVGVISEREVPRGKRGEPFTTTEATRTRIRTLAAEGLHDADIAARLDLEGIRPGRGTAWTVASVRWVRRRANISRCAPDRPRILPLPDRYPDGRYSIPGAARRFGVSQDVVRTRLKHGRIQGTVAPYGTYRQVYWLTIDEVTARRLTRLAARTRRK